MAQQVKGILPRVYLNNASNCDVGDHDVINSIRGLVITLFSFKFKFSGFVRLKT